MSCFVKNKLTQSKCSPEYFELVEKLRLQYDEDVDYDGVVVVVIVVVVSHISRTKELPLCSP